MSHSIAALVVEAGRPFIGSVHPSPLLLVVGDDADRFAAEPYGYTPYGGFEVDLDVLSGEREWVTVYEADASDDLMFGSVQPALRNVTTVVAYRVAGSLVFEQIVNRYDLGTLPPPTLREQPPE